MTDIERVTPLVAVARDKFCTARPGQLWDGTPECLHDMEVMSLEDALSRIYATDAHLTTAIVSKDGAPLRRQPRLVKESLSVIRDQGLEVFHHVLVADIDMPGHGDLTQDALRDFISRVGALGWYPTLHGFRVYEIQKNPLTPEQWEHETALFRKRLRLAFPNLVVDEACKAWSWFFRLPHVTRDGADPVHVDVVIGDAVDNIPPDVPEQIDEPPQPSRPWVEDHPWALERLARSCAALVALTSGGYRRLVAAAFELGGLVGGGLLTREQVLSEVATATSTWNVDHRAYEAIAAKVVAKGERLLAEVPPSWRAVHQHVADEVLEDMLREGPAPHVQPLVGVIDESDLGNARLLFTLYRDRMRVVGSERSVYWCAENGLWADKGFPTLRRHAGYLIDGCIEDTRAELADLPPEPPKGVAEDREIARLRKALEKNLQWWLSSKTARKLSSMCTLALDHCEPIAHDDFDSRVDLLPFTNGVLELDTGRLRPLRPEDMFTKTIRFAFDPNARCPLWEAALPRWQPNPEVRDWLHRRAGSYLCGDVEEMVLEFFWGPGGTGKSTYVESIAHALGPFAAKMNRTVYERQKSGVSHPTDVWRLRGLRFAYATELDPRLYVERLNELVGCEKVSARGIGQDMTEFRPHAKHLLCSNTKPKVPKSLDDGIWRRIALVPWLQRFRDEGAEVFAETEGAVPIKRDTQIFEKLRGEAPGIMVWLYEGYKLWRKKPLFPFPVQIATEVRALAAGDTLEFLESEFERREESGARVTFDAVWRSRQLWNKDRNEGKYETKNAFSRSLTKAGVKTEQHGKRRITFVMGWVGVEGTPRPEDLVDEEEIKNLIN